MLYIVLILVQSTCYKQLTEDRYHQWDTHTVNDDIEIRIHKIQRSLLSFVAVVGKERTGVLHGHSIVLSARTSRGDCR